ncbi:MAG: Rne/Rng family ribonuclease [Defluviitaleaceae bacterium]|nr:Rne/Rng family ribonuclease [Defluviitaleaceae bacterium]
MKRLFFENRADGVYTALTIDGKLREIYIDSPENTSMVGQIILGRLEVVLPGQMAFVDLGIGKKALMNISKEVKLQKNQPVLVQVYKDPTGTKGAYVGMELKHKGRHVILFESPRRDIGISQKITDSKERGRLRETAQQAIPKGFGIIIRTNAQGVEPEKIIADIDELLTLHKKIKTQAEHADFPALIYPEDDAVPSVLPDMISEDLDEIWVSGLDFDAIKKAVTGIMPTLANRIFLYESLETANLFEFHNIPPQISAALKKTVQLPCGGFITIEQTEACVVIDVNTGRYTGKKDFRTTALTTNLEAATSIAWQLVLRNLSGIIIIDFMDMKHDEDKNVLLDALARELKNDRIKTEIVGITDLGLVQLTRRRARESLARLLEQDCPNCGGRGRVRIQQ